MLCQVCLQSFCQLTPRQHDAPAAAFALESDVSAQTRDSPLIRTARVLLPETKVIVETQVG